MIFIFILHFELIEFKNSSLNVTYCSARNNNQLAWSCFHFYVSTFYRLDKYLSLYNKNNNLFYSLNLIFNHYNPNISNGKPTPKHHGRLSTQRTRFPTCQQLQHFTNTQKNHPHWRNCLQRFTHPRM